MEEHADVEAVGNVPRASSRHIKKRALRNKALTISFNEKDLRDYVTGFHKRKKKRRKEAQQQLKEKERLKRIANRKKRKEERDYVMYGGARPANNSADNDNTNEIEQDEETQLTAPISGTKMYDNEDMTITVTTSEILREETEALNEKTLPVSRWSSESKGKYVPLTAKPCKRVAKNRSLPKLNKKGDKKKGQKNKNMH